jgi:hypothetical protein
VPPNRSSILTSPLNLEGIGLEIGPSYNPIIPKSRGLKVETLDYIDAPSLKKKYEGVPNIDTNYIESVDYVTGKRTIAETINAKSRFDYIIASHAIEHMPDMLGFLAQCEDLLTPSGILALAVPDKRFCFDVVQPISTTGQVLQAHMEGRRRSTPGDSFDFHANFSSRDGQLAWGRRNRSPVTQTNNAIGAKALFDQIAEGTDYVDMHLWRYTPSSFRLIIRDLNEIGVLQITEHDFKVLGGSEFFVFLSRNGHGCPHDRTKLFRMIHREVRSVPPI